MLYIANTPCTVCCFQVTEVHIVLQLYCLLASGTQEYLKDISTNLWCHLMLNESSAAPRFYSTAFKNRCDSYLLRRFNMKQEDIKHYNLKNVFVRLLNYIS